jgi:hypothetical protein
VTTGQTERAFDPAIALESVLNTAVEAGVTGVVAMSGVGLGCRDVSCATALPMKIHFAAIRFLESLQ